MSFAQAHLPLLPDVAVTMNMAEWAEIAEVLIYDGDPRSVALADVIKAQVQTALSARW